MWVSFFLVPGIKETLRVNGSAEIITDSDLKARFWDKNRLPLSIIKEEIQEVFLHCSKAFISSALWNPESIQSFNSSKYGRNAKRPKW